MVQAPRIVQAKGLQPHVQLQPYVTYICKTLIRGRKEGPGGGEGPKSDLKKINKENDTRTTLGVAEDQRNERKNHHFGGTREHKSLFYDSLTFSYSET